MSAIASMSYSFPLHNLADNDDSDVDSDSEMSIDFRSGSSRTTVDLSMRSSSPTPSVLSVTSSIRAQAIAHEHGRGINTSSEVYRLPADEEEVERLDLQHQMLRQITGQYPPPLRDIMVDDIPGEKKAILDLGCGSGRWIMEAAVDFPDCYAVAVDLVPMQSTSMPLNCRSETDDINLGLEHFYHDFNVVHMRLICTGIKDYPRVIEQISSVLRPGGLIELLEFGYQIYDENKQIVVVSTSSLEPPWLPLWMTFAYMAAARNGGSVDAAPRLHDYVRNIPVFENIVHTKFWIPSSPWLQGDDSETKRLNELGALMTHDIMEFLKAGRPLLLNSGLPEIMVDELEMKSRREIEEGARYYILLEHLYAIRR